MPKCTPSPESPSPSPDQRRDWPPTRFDPDDPRVKQLAWDWMEMSRLLHRDVAAAIMVELVDVWHELGVTASMDIPQLAESLSFTEAEVAAGVQYLVNRKMINQREYGYQVPFASAADFHEAFDARFPGVRLDLEPEPYEPSRSIPNSRVKDERPGSVYLLRCHNRYKIGISRQLETRVNQLCNIQSPYPVELLHHVTGTDYRAFEKQLHDKYQSDRVHGEWFSLDSEQVESLIAEMNEWERGE
jgi:hypothetical protein